MVEAARSAGRDPDQITISMMGPAVMAENQEALKTLLGEAAAFRDITADALVERWKKAGVPFGTVNEVTEAFGHLGDAGVEKYYLQWLQLGDHNGIADLVRLAHRILN